MRTVLLNSIIAATVLAGSSVYAAPIDLNFSNPHNINYDKNIYWSPADRTTSSPVVHYTNVGSKNGVTLDARVTAEVFGDYLFDWQAPNYKESTNGQPNGDIGFLYRRDSSLALSEEAHGGLRFVFELFDGSGDKSNSYTEAYVANELAIIAYDVDGELDNPYNTQSENLRVFKDDGLFSYTTGSNAASLIATDMGNEILFEGPGTNFDEADTSGAVLLHYANTSSFTLQFESMTFADMYSNNNPIFSAIDGDLFLEFEGEAVEVAEPHTIALFSTALFAFSFGFAKRRAKKMALSH